MKSFLAAAVAGVAMSALASFAEASMVTQAFEPALTAKSYKQYAVPLNLLLVGSNDWSQINFTVYSEYYYSSGDASWDCYTRLTADTHVQVAMAGAEVLNVQPGTSVGPGLTYSNGQATLAGYFRYKGWSTGWDPASYGGTFGGGSVVPGYLGLQLSDGAHTYYGWMRVEVTGNTTQTLTVFESAVNTTPDAPIVVGQVVPAPEPASLAMVGGGMMWLFRRRR